ncbi:MAG: chloride channel protein [Terrimicrobiaceae bacterium]
MDLKTDNTGHDESDREVPGLIRACVAALLGGLLIGVIGAAFRTGLSWIEARHLVFTEWALALGWVGWFLPILLGAVGAGLARLIVRPEPLAAGSGVQHVEAVMRGETGPIGLIAVPIKFFGGLLSLGSGLALGREGPTIQMGATIGAALARWFRCAAASLADVQAALGGAGLAVAFNAPLGGAMFVFEEVARAFRLRLTVVTLLGTTTAIVTARAILGDAPDFRVVPPAPGETWTLLLFAVFGGLLGLLGVLYNKCTIFGLDALAKLRTWPTELRAALVGAIVGLVACFFPRLVGGGDPSSQEILLGTVPWGPLMLILAVRWFLGPLSYAAGTPGGIFSPLLLVGAALGALFAMGGNALIPADSSLSVVAFAVVGMAAFFTGVVRAPLTGIILISEMTATNTLMVPMLAAGFGAMLTSSLVRGEPIYDTLRHRMLKAMGK